MRYFNILEAPELAGLAVKEPGKLWRLPAELGERLNSYARAQYKANAGACVRFRTDSPVVEVRVTLLKSKHGAHTPPTGHSGVDFWFDGCYAGVCPPPNDYALTFRGRVERPFYLPEGVYDVQINLPLLNSVVDMEIGVEGELLPPTPHKIQKPVLFYGSSIVQGEGLCKPGNNYTVMLSRRLDFELINLGFCGGARGEPFLADFIASHDLAAFVLDYDHNDDPSELRAKHEPFFRTVREKHPGLPIVIASRGDIESAPKGYENREIVRATYENAVKNGDKNVYFIDGESYFGREYRGECTVDGIHPNALGTRLMVETIKPVLEKALAQA